MKIKGIKGLFVILSIIAINGCSHYEQTMALGAVAGAATGALIVDSTYDNNHYGHGGYYGGHYGGGHYRYNEYPRYSKHNDGVYRHRTGYIGYHNYRNGNSSAFEGRTYY